MLNQKAMSDYAAAVTTALRTAQVRFPNQVNGERLGALVEECVGRSAEPGDIRTAVARLARESEWFKEPLFWDHLTAARKSRELAEGRNRAALPATTAPPPVMDEERKRRVYATIIVAELIRIWSWNARQAREGRERDPRGDAGIAPSRAESVWAVMVQEPDLEKLRKDAIDFCAMGRQITGSDGFASVIADVARGAFAKEDRR